MPTHTLHKAAGPTGIMRFPQVRQETGLSRSTVWRQVKAGEFPAPLQISGNSVGWLASEIQEWVASRPRVIPGQAA